MEDRRAQGGGGDERPAGAGASPVRTGLILLCVAALFFLTWQLKSLLLLVFGAVLVAVIFRSIADPIHRRLGVPNKAALAIVIIFLIGLLGLAGWMFGSEVAAQVRNLAASLPAAIESAEQRFGDTELAERIRSMLEQSSSSGSAVLSSVGGYAMTLFGGITDAVLVIVAGIYFAVQPQMYHAGLLKLLPPSRRAAVDEALRDSARALQLWLKGALISMTVVGLLVGIGLWLLGVPSALALGLLAGLLDFVPLVGPIVAAIPGILIALTLGPEMALWTAGLYLLVQQIEGNILQPVVQQHTVDLPAALLLFALLGFGMVFGILGILLAAPKTVVLYVLVKRLYVVEALRTETDIPGEEQA